jgi:autotransporter translocation and assembly factor TamB
MKRKERRRLWGAAAIALACIVALALWQWQALARLAIVAAVEATVHVRLALANATLGWNRAVLENVSVTSFRGEPIATVRRLSLEYNLRDLLPGGSRLFGLKSVDVDSPRVTVTRHADGSYNVPVLQLPANKGAVGPPTIVRLTVRNGSIHVVDQSRDALPDQRRLYVEHVDVSADISTSTRSRYEAALGYGERPDRLYPVRGRGDVDAKLGYNDQRWTAPSLPIAAAANFVVNSSSLQLRAGMLRDVDARYAGLADASGTIRPHLAATAFLDGGVMSIAGLSKPIDGVRGGLDVDDDGLTTARLDASVAGIPVRVSGGIYGLRDPRVRFAVRGKGDLSALRSAFDQARRLPMRGPLSFGLLVEGPATKPTTWIDLSSPSVTYAAATLGRIRGLAAFDGHEADVLRFGGAYRGATLSAGGRIVLVKEPRAIELLLGVRASTNDVPYAATIVPRLPLQAVALASAEDPKSIGLLGALWGSGASRSVDGVFDVDSRGVGSIGPVHLNLDRGSIYARAALDRPRGEIRGLVAARGFPVTPARGRLSASLFGMQTKAEIAALGTAQLRGAWGAASGAGSVALRGRSLRGSVYGSALGEAAYGAAVSGTAHSPRLAGTVVVAGGRYRNFDVNGNAGVSYRDGAVRVSDAAAAIGPLFVALAGTITGIAPGSGTPRYDLAAQIHSSDVGALLATVQPRAAELVQGSIDANLRVRGTKAAPSFAGTMSAPEGSVNGLSFRDLHGNVRGGSAAITVSGAHVVVGSSPISFDTSASLASTSVALAAPRLDLADLNDFFDTGDTLAGTGSLALRARVAGTRIAETSGSAFFSSARFRRIALGRVASRWRSTGGSIVSSTSFGGRAGEVSVRGSVDPAAMRADLAATARNVDLSTWLPMLGYTVPVTGRLDAETSLAGRYPDVALRLHAAVLGGTAGRVAIERFEVTAAASHGRGEIASAVLDTPSLATTARGTFGFRPGDRLALTIDSNSADIGRLLREATGMTYDVSGTLDSALRVGGTLAYPSLRDTLSIRALRYGSLTIPRVAGEIDADRHSLGIRGGEIDLEKGRALFAALVPVRVTDAGVAAARGPITGSIAAQDVELSNFAAMLPKGTQLAGRIDGNVVANGALTDPQIAGSLTLRDGTFSGPMEKSPIAGITAELTLHGSHAQLQSRGTVGGGLLTANATATLADLRRPAEFAFAMEAKAQNARLDLPAYFQGNLNGSVTVARTRATPPQVSGSVAVSNARIPLNAFLNLKGGGQGGPALPNVAFTNLSISAGPNVRVQSANVDIGAAGNATLRGTLRAPTLAGSFASTGGTLSFYRTFNLESGNVTFDAASGLIPDIDAAAATYVADPPTAVRLHVTGPATSMNLALTSDPSYSREQILGLLVGAQQFGAVRGVRTTANQSFSAGSAVANVGLGQLNTLFTRNLLEPLSSSVASALGFTTVAITTDIQTGLGISAGKALGKNVRAIYSQTFGYPKTQAVTFEAYPNSASGARFTWYTSTGPTLFALQGPQSVGMDVLNLNPYTQLPPATGNNGISLSYQRKFW